MTSCRSHEFKDSRITQTSEGSEINSITGSLRSTKTLATAVSIQWAACTTRAAVRAASESCQKRCRASRAAFSSSSKWSPYSGGSTTSNFANDGEYKYDDDVATNSLM